MNNHQNNNSKSVFEHKLRQKFKIFIKRAYLDKVFQRLAVTDNNLPKPKEAAIWKHIGDIDFRKYVDIE